MNKKTLFLILFTLLLQYNAFAFSIIAVDDSLFTFKEATFEKDSHRYKTIFEVNEKEGTITALKNIDLNLGFEYESGILYQIVVTSKFQPTYHKRNLKGVFLNQKTGGVEVITFCEGTFMWVKVQDKYMNMSTGTYVSDKKL